MWTDPGPNTTAPRARDPATGTWQDNHGYSHYKHTCAHARTSIRRLNEIITDVAAVPLAAIQHLAPTRVTGWTTRAWDRIYPGVAAAVIIATEIALTPVHILTASFDVGVMVAFWVIVGAYETGISIRDIIKHIVRILYNPRPLRRYTTITIALILFIIHRHPSPIQSLDCDALLQGVTECGVINQDGRSACVRDGTNTIALYNWYITAHSPEVMVLKETTGTCKPVFRSRSTSIVVRDLLPHAVVHTLNGTTAYCVQHLDDRRRDNGECRYP